MSHKRAELGFEPRPVWLLKSGSSALSLLLHVKNLFVGPKAEPFY